MSYCSNLPHVSPEAEQQSVRLRSPLRSPTVRHNLRSLLYSVADRLDANDLERMIFLSSDVINSEMEKESITSGFMLFEIFLKRGVIGEENIDLLLDLLAKIRRFDLNKRAKEKWGVLQCSPSWVLPQPKSLQRNEHLVTGPQQTQSHEDFLAKKSADVRTSRPENAVQRRRQQFELPLTKEVEEISVHLPAPTLTPESTIEELVSEDENNLCDRDGQPNKEEQFRGRANAMGSTKWQIVGGDMGNCNKSGAIAGLSTLFERGQCAAGEPGIDVRERAAQQLVGEPFRKRTYAVCSRRRQTDLSWR
ncbi:uncharacterized protein [Diadema antillarum]|uniref:uncharacterized protein n=1 Tax=Diadema antillarum TaxID=105358 RepID=UPI003A878BB3